MMKRPAVFAPLPLLLAICFVLFLAADGSRASTPPEEPSEPAVPRHPVLRDDELHQHQSAATETGTRPVAAGVDMERADDGAAPSATASARGEDQGGAAKSWHWSVSPSRLMRSNLARRVQAAGAPPVEGAEGRPVRADDGAATSATAPARGEDPSGVARSRRWTASSSRSSPPLLRSASMARRVLLTGAPPGDGAADSAARSSCHSSDVHVGCPPHQ